MIIGVVSDTHNNIKNIKNIINIFNNEEVEAVIHTGDISKAETLKVFSLLKCPLMGVFGNNDRIEVGLTEVCSENNFTFQEPPFFLVLGNKKLAIFHEPNLIDDCIQDHKDLDLILHGHTHRYRNEIIKDITYFNPGESAGFLKGKSALGIIDLKDLKIKRIFF